MATTRAGVLYQRGHHHVNSAWCQRTTTPAISEITRSLFPHFPKTPNLHFKCLCFVFRFHPHSCHISGASASSFISTPTPGSRDSYTPSLSLLGVFTRRQRAALGLIVDIKASTSTEPQDSPSTPSLTTIINKIFISAQSDLHCIQPQVIYSLPPLPLSIEAVFKTT